MELFPMNLGRMNILKLGFDLTWKKITDHQNTKGHGLITIKVTQCDTGGICIPLQWWITRRERWPRRGAPTPETVTFQKFCLSKRKNLVPRAGVRRARPPPPPQIRQSMTFKVSKSISTILYWEYKYLNLDCHWILRACHESILGFLPSYNL